MRRNIYDIINDKKIDLQREYSRIYELFYETEFYSGATTTTLYNYVDFNFKMFDKNYIGRCISLDDFNRTYGFMFEAQPEELSIDYLILFSEYVFNCMSQLMRYRTIYKKDFFLVIDHIKSCMEDIGYVLLEKNEIFIFVEKNPAALSVAETTKPELSYSVLEYNHHLLKGDIPKKKNILKNMADDIESDRKELKKINASIESDLFQLLNKFIRHDSSENKYISNLQSSELEKIYDEIYQMWLLAKLQLEHLKQKDMIDEIINKINEKKK